jgi:diadenylate cyclase
MNQKIKKPNKKDRTLELCGDICSEKRGVNPDILKQLIMLAVEISREGREGRKIGSLFIIGDSKEVIKRSKCLILDPLFGHPEQNKMIDDYNLRETIKEIAQLDGAFIISEGGVFLSACRYIDATSREIKIPLGFGARHMAAASITKITKAVAVVVSESSMVRIFDDGELISEIIPEVWMLSEYSIHLEGPYLKHTEKDITIISKGQT